MASVMIWTELSLGMSKIETPTTLRKRIYRINGNYHSTYLCPTCSSFSGDHSGCPFKKAESRFGTRYG